MGIRRFLPGVLVLFVAVVPLGAGDGAMPIWQATTLTEPGHYVVTRDITHEGTILFIDGHGIEIDLNGFTLENTSWDPVIDVDPASYGVAVRNGYVEGLGTGARSSGDDVLLEDLTIHGCLVGMEVEGTGVRVERNQILGAVEIGISIPGCHACRIADNQVTDSSYGDSLWQGISTGMIMGTEVTRNLVHAAGNAPPGGEPGIAIDIGWGVGSVIRDNVVTESFGMGIRVGTGTGNRILYNTVNNAGGTALFVESWMDEITGNHLTANGTGLELNGTECIYGGNFARNNASGDFTDTGTNNTSRGDNYMPTQM